MELQKLKSTWKSVEPYLPQQVNPNIVPTSTVDNKSKLLRRIYWSMSITVSGIIFMISSMFWAHSHLEIWWIIAVCILLFIGVLTEIRLANLVRRIHLDGDSQSEVLKSVIRIKKYYRNVELWISGGFALLVGYLPFTSSSINIGDLALVWGLIIIGLTLEYMWYRKSAQYINQLENWSK